LKYSRFEELPVWQAAVDFALLVFQFTNIADLRGLGDTKNQLERSALSISNNIAEGFERGTTAELINFLYIARGSAGESRSMLSLCERVPRFSNFKSEISNLKARGENISRQLQGWIESLKNSDIKGNKFLTRKERERIDKDREFAEFDAQMEEFRRRHLEMLNRRSAEAAIRSSEEESTSRKVAET
jgi:four helix bundle protein